MSVGEAGKRVFRALALTTGLALVASCASTAPPNGVAPPAGEDWRTLRRIDLPAMLVSATWDEGVVLGDGNPVRIGRMSIAMRASNPGAAVVKTPKNALAGLIVDNLSCYNSVMGERRCAMLLNAPNRCHLFVYASPHSPDSARSGTADGASSGSSDGPRPGDSSRSRMTESEDYGLVCPRYLLLGR